MFRDIYRLLVGDGSGRYFPVPLVFDTRGANYYIYFATITYSDLVV